MQAQPIPGLPIRAPLVSPTPGSTIVGYQIVEPHGGCNCDLRLEGWLAVIILLFVRCHPTRDTARRTCCLRAVFCKSCTAASTMFFFPLAWIPCCMQECAQRYQVPIYGSPGQVPAGGIPVGGEYQQTAYPPQYHQAAPPPQYEQPGYPQKGVAAVPPASAQEAARPGQPNSPTSEPPPAVGVPPPVVGVPPPGIHPPPHAPGQPAYGQYPAGAAYVTAPEPVFGLPIRAPLVSPQPGQTVLGYQIVEPHGGCNLDLRLEGWLVVLILLILFWPLAWIPCCLPECFQRYQVPVYGYPGQAMPIGHVPYGNVPPYA